MKQLLETFNEQLAYEDFKAISQEDNVIYTSDGLRLEVIPASLVRYWFIKHCQNNINDIIIFELYDQFEYIPFYKQFSDIMDRRLKMAHTSTKKLFHDIIKEANNDAWAYWKIACNHTRIYRESIEICVALCDQHFKTSHMDREFADILDIDSRHLEIRGESYFAMNAQKPQAYT